MALPDVLPAGMQIPDDDEAQAQPEAESQGQGQADHGKESGTDQPQGEELILGKFKTHDDLAKAYKELESMSGRQSTDVGDLRKQNELLLKQLEFVHQQAAGKQEAGTKAEKAQEPNFDAQLAEIQKQVEEGEIDISQALRLTSDITANKALHLASQQQQQMAQQQQMQSYQDSFIKDNPDFVQLQKDGTLQQIRQQNPWLYPDDVSAYQAVQIQRLQGQIEEASKTGYQQGRQEVTKLAEGSEAARKVLAKPGADIRRAGNANKPLNDADLKASMLSRLG